MTDQLFQVAPKLRERQAFVYELLKTGASSPLTVGVFLHAHQGCRFCKPKEPCQYAESSGREVLEALKRKGLVRRDRHHLYRRVDSAPPEPNAGASDYDPATAAIPF